MQIKNSRQPTDPILTFQLKRIKNGHQLNTKLIIIFLMAVIYKKRFANKQRFRLYFYLLSDFYGLSLNSSFANQFLSFFLKNKQVHSASVRARAAREQIRAVSCAPSETANLLLTEQNGPRQPFTKLLVKFFNDAIVFLMHNALGYALMLSVMVYSGWLFAAVVLGMGLGYFVFGHISMKINMENVQARTTKVICAPACGAEAGQSTANGSPSRDSSMQPSTSTSTLATATIATISCSQEKNDMKTCDSAAPCC